mmetsp:Transcript_473/g.441  ORF Transcript_473/g.441 Transcript_473/m.441 type:complete len:108 (+) Transcript_473:441-764(+)
MWCLEDEKCEFVLENAHVDGVNCISFNLKDTKLLSGGCDGLIKLWDIEKQICLEKICGHSMAVTKVIFGMDDKEIVSCSLDGTVRVFCLDKHCGEDCYLMEWSSSMN